MIVVDSSAIVAIALREAEQPAFEAIIAKNESCVAAPTVLEIVLVLSGQPKIDVLDFVYNALARADVAIIPFDSALVKIAAHAFLRFGKGRHPAKLNYGDCMAYALAKSLGAPLLFKGNDFALTDIESVI